MMAEVTVTVNGQTYHVKPAANDIAVDVESPEPEGAAAVQGKAAPVVRNKARKTE